MSIAEGITSSWKVPACLALMISPQSTKRDVITVGRNGLLQFSPCLSPGYSESKTSFYSLLLNSDNLPRAFPCQSERNTGFAKIDVAHFLPAACLGGRSVLGSLPLCEGGICLASLRIIRGYSSQKSPWLVPDYRSGGQVILNAYIYMLRDYCLYSVRDASSWLA